MRVEISALFHLLWTDKRRTAVAPIGGGVCLGRLDPAWLTEAKAQCPTIAAREQIEMMSPYTDRFFYETEAEESPLPDENLVSGKEKQPILRAITLSRLVKPTAIAYDSVWVKSFYRSDGTVRHYHEQVINNLNVAFLADDQGYNTITDGDLTQMAALWGDLEFLLDDANEPTYRRVVRAIKFNEFAYAVYFPEISHPVTHAALESLICTNHIHNKAQVTQRLSQLVPFISFQEAEDIYHVCCDFKHAAQAILQEKRTNAGAFSPNDQRRVNSVGLLRRGVRYLLIQALQDRRFADLLSHPTLLRNTVLVYDKSGNPICDKKGNPI